MADNKTSSGGIGGVAFVIGLAVLGYILWQNGCFPHTTVAIVVFKSWGIGEYKTCTQPNIPAMKDEPQLDCLEGDEYTDSKKFEVSFEGNTYNEEEGDKVTVQWQCKRENGTDPSFTCDQRKVINWQNTNP
jgi:hypothetical protein